MSNSSISRLTLAFAELRKQGFVTLGDYMCCGGCASANIEHHRKNKELYCVYFHRQDTDNVIPEGTLYLRYGTFGTKGKSTVEEETEAGVKISAVLKQYQFTVIWNGNPKECIEIKKFQCEKMDRPLLTIGHANTSSVYKGDESEDKDTMADSDD